MSTTFLKQLKEVTDLAIAKKKCILPDIAKYIGYNYHMHLKIKEGNAVFLEGLVKMTMDY